MALLSLTFPPGTLATVVKSGGSTWTVTSVNTTTVTVSVDDINNNGTISNAEWDAAIGGGGNDTGSINYLFEGTGSSGQLYALNGTTFTVGQNVTAIKSTLSNSFEANVSSVICLTKGTDVLTSTGWRAIEAISVGDAVVTANDNSEVVRWIGQRRLDRTDLENNPKLYPVRISKGTLGNGLPLRISSCLVSIECWFNPTLRHGCLENPRYWFQRSSLRKYLGSLLTRLSNMSNIFTYSLISMKSYLRKALQQKAFSLGRKL